MKDQDGIINLLPINGLTMEIVVGLHAHFQDYNKTALWLTTKNLNLGGYAPVEMTQQGRAQMVIQFIESCYEESLCPHGIEPIYRCFECDPNTGVERK